MLNSKLVQGLCLCSALLLSSCAATTTPHDSQSAGGKFCRDIKRQLHIGDHRYNRRQKISANQKASIIKLYKKDCEDSYMMK